MRELMYLDQAQDYYCPFSIPSKMYCLAGDCLAWEEVEDGQGVCSRLSPRRIITTGTEPLQIDSREVDM